LVIIGVFVALIVFLIARLVRDRGPLPVRRSGAEPSIDVLAQRSPEQWLAAARDAEAADDWRTAVRCRHQALTTTLIRRGIVAARPGQTAGEIEQLVSQQQPQVAASMREATWLFKETWYGWMEADRESSMRFQALSDEILAREMAPA